MRWLLVYAATLLCAATTHAQGVYGKAYTLRRFTDELLPESVETSCVFWAVWDYDDGSNTYDYSTSTNDVDAPSVNAIPAWSNDYGGIRSFDGTDDRYTWATNQATFFDPSVVPTSGPFSVVSWIMPLDTGAFYPLGYGGAAGAGAGALWVIGRGPQSGSSGRIRFVHRTQGGSALAQNGTTSLNIDTWYMIAMTSNGAGGTNRPAFYLDGVQEALTVTGAQQLWMNNIIADSPQEISVGAFISNGSRTFGKGRVGMLAIFSSDVSAHITNLYNITNNRNSYK